MMHSNHTFQDLMARRHCDVALPSHSSIQTSSGMPTDVADN